VENIRVPRQSDFQIGVVWIGKLRASNHVLKKIESKFLKNMVKSPQFTNPNYPNLGFEENFQFRGTLENIRYRKLKTFPQELVQNS
jgi:hypothetical protein